jgi:hypothetical protein
VDDSDSCAPANDPCKDYISDYSEFYKTNIWSNLYEAPTLCKAV